MDCRRWAIDDDRSRRKWAIDEDRRRIRWAVDDDRRRRRWAVDDEEDDYPPLQLPLQWRDPPPHYPREENRQRRRDVDRDRRREALQLAQVEASIDRIDDFCVNFIQSVERIMSRPATIPSLSLLCSTNTQAQTTLIPSADSPAFQSLQQNGTLELAEQSHAKSSPIVTEEATAAVTSPLPLVPSSDPSMRHPNLKSTEKPFYELIGEKYSSSPNHFPLYSSPSLEILDSNKSHNSNNSGIQSFQDNSEFPEYQNYEIPLSRSSLSFVNGHGSGLLFKTLPTIQFKEGKEEAKKFLPSIDKLTLKVGEINLTLLQNPIKQERRQKNRYLDDSGFEETRRINQLAFSYEEPVIPLEMFDDVLLCSCERFPQDVRAIREKVYTEEGKDSKNSIPNESGVSRKSRWKKQLKEEVVDFNSFLLHCAHTMDNDDNLRGYEFLKQIWQHSSPHDNASLRLAHYFANSLQASLAGTGREVHLKQISILNVGYAWIATDWLSSVLDYSGSADPVTMSLIHGAIVLHPYTPDSNIKQNFLLRWNKLLQKGYVSSSLNSYGLYAYDTVWLVAYAIDQFLNEGGTVSFSHNPRLSNVNGSLLSAILHACAILKVLGDGLLVQGCAIHHGFTPFVYVYNGLVKMHAKCGDIKSASKVFDEMKAKEFGVVFAYVGARPPNQLCLVGFVLEKASEVGFENDLHRILLAPALKWLAFIDFLLALRDKYAVASTHGGMQNSGRPKQLLQLMNEIVDIHRRCKIFDPGGWHISTESNSFDARGE
ncbi:hypothetical protein KFK09_024957 [Dendrobium nobile]|uniref:Receptor ligand binding region domain-containing protein n=1 Tax=Dendrobium nobile TaxID=94219 RepID=A0A8T3AFI6_DENNO|nr:hypothetical protein KFK09_024957 [Dendrobium nobile]